MSKLAFLMLWVFVFIIPWENIFVLPGIGTIARLAGITAFVTGLLSLIVSPKIRFHPLHVCGLFFYFVALASFFWSLQPDLTLTRLITYAQLLAAAWLIFQLAVTEQQVHALFSAYVLGAMVAVLATIHSYLEEAGVFHARFAAPGFDPNDLAFILCLAIPLAWYLGFTHKQGVLQWLYYIYPFLAIFAILLTASRAGFLGAVVAVLFLMLTYGRLPRSAKVAVFFLAIAGAGIVFTLVPSESIARAAMLDGELTREISTLNERTIIWATGYEVFKESPLVGVGAGTFRAAVEPYLGRPGAPHNVFVAVTVEQGVLGLLVFILILASALISVSRMSQSERWLWFIIFGVLFLAFMSLNWEWRKQTWLMLSLAVTHAAALRRVRQYQEINQ
jgi:O-antigen ligase